MGVYAITGIHMESALKTKNCYFKKDTKSSISI